MKRERATQLLEDLLQQAHGSDWPVGLVQAVYVFGSYARGALEPDVLDVAVDIDVHDERWQAHNAYSASYGYDPYSILRQALRGHKRSVAVEFEPKHLTKKARLTLLWRRGEPLEHALRRVHGIPVEAIASRAPRSAMLPCFEGVDQWLQLSVREEIITMVSHGAITVEQVSVPDTEISDPVMRRLIDRRWSATSPLHRAALATLAYLDEQGVDLQTVDLHGLVLGQPDVPYYVDFEKRYLPFALQRLEHHGATHWLAILRPARRGPLPALHIAVRDRHKLSTRPHGGIMYFR